MMQTSLFETDLSEPLASRLRPLTLDTYVGQKHLVAQGKILWQLIEHDHIPSMIFWGPPGVGKTTLARVIAHSTKADFVDFSAVTSSIKDIKTVMKRAEEKRRKQEIQKQKNAAFQDRVTQQKAKVDAQKGRTGYEQYRISNESYLIFMRYC